MLEGNHDKRIATMIIQQMPAAYELVSATAKISYPIVSIPFY